MAAQATEDFEDAPIRIVEYADLLCPDCRFLAEQLDQLKEEFAGQLNIAFQLFPLEGQCNSVVEKDLHPGACEVSYIAAYDPSKFQAIHDEVFANLRAARDPEWRLALAQRHGVEAALQDSTTIELVRRMINTGAEYEKTSDQFAHGIRSTPTMIINGRMIIGTLPYDQLRAIFQALVDEYERGEDSRFIENWEPNR
jgi:protein-disulfide isomerase